MANLDVQSLLVLKIKPGLCCCDSFQFHGSSILTLCLTVWVISFKLSTAIANYRDVTKLQVKFGDCEGKNEHFKPRKRSTAREKTRKKPLLPSCYTFLSAGQKDNFYTQLWINSPRRIYIYGRFDTNIHPKCFSHIYRISSNNSRARLFVFSHQKGAIIRERRLFQVLFTGGRALNILFYFPIKSKNNHIKETEYGLISVPNLVPWLISIVNILGVVTDQLCWIKLHFSLILQIYRYGYR